MVSWEHMRITSIFFVVLIINAVLCTTVTVKAQTTSPTIGADATTAYISPQMQQLLIQTEQNNVAMLQSANSSLQSSQAAAGAQRQMAYIPGLSRDQRRQMYEGMQTQNQANTAAIQTSQQTQSTIAAQYNQSLQRLAILQSGPVTISQYTQMYQPQ